MNIVQKLKARRATLDALKPAPATPPIPKPRSIVTKAPTDAQLISRAFADHHIAELERLGSLPRNPKRLQLVFTGYIGKPHPLTGKPKCVFSQL